MKMQAATDNAAPVIVVSVKSEGIFRKKSIILRPLMVARAARRRRQSSSAAWWCRARALAALVDFAGFSSVRSSACTPTWSKLGSRPLRDSLPRAITAQQSLAAETRASKKTLCDEAEASVYGR